MSAVADNDAVRPAAEPLGTLLLKRGLITSEQLAAALEAQKGSGEPLGAIVVAHGFATPATIAQALATQSGGLLKTEYGFATGFGSSTDRPVPIGEPPISTVRIGVRLAAPFVETEPPAQRQVEAATALAEPPAVEPQVGGLAADQNAVRAELAAASVETERLSSANERLAEVRAELEQRLAHEAQRASALEAEVATRDAALEEFRVASVGWQAAHAELEERLAQATERAASAPSTETGGTQLEERLAQELAAAASRDETIAELRLALDQAADVTPERQPADKWASAVRHLLFFQGSESYELVERAGPPPSPGASVDVAGELNAQIVTRVGSAPVPGSDLPCAYLIAA